MRVHARVKRAGRCTRLALAALCMSGVASANFTCEGKITYLGLGVDGTVHVAVGFGVWYVCSPSSPVTYGGATFSPEGCRAWYASMLAAQKSEQPIRFWFTSSVTNTNGPECTALGSWAFPSIAPYHLALVY